MADTHGTRELTEVEKQRNEDEQARKAREEEKGRVDREKRERVLATLRNDLRDVENKTDECRARLQRSECKKEEMQKDIDSERNGIIKHLEKEIRQKEDVLRKLRDRLDDKNMGLNLKQGHVQQKTTEIDSAQKDLESARQEERKILDKIKNLEHRH